MNNIKLLTGGLVVIVLALAGGTGYLIYERIQDEVTVQPKVTQEQIKNIETDVKTLKESDEVQSARIDVLEDEVIDAKDRLNKAEGKLDLQEKAIKKLEENKASKEDLEAATARVSQLESEAKKERERVDEVESQLAEARKEREEIRKQLQAQGVKIEEQERRLDELEKKGDAHDAELAALRAELAELKRQLGLGDDPSPSN